LYNDRVTTCRQTETDAQTTIALDRHRHGRIHGLETETATETLTEIKTETETETEIDTGTEVEVETEKEAKTHLAHIITNREHAEVRTVRNVPRKFYLTLSCLLQSKRTGKPRVAQIACEHGCNC